MIMNRIRSNLCVSGFSPTPRVTWKRLDAQMSEKVEFASQGQELVISSAEFDDAGRYQCEGTNEVDSSTKDIILAVECKLVIFPSLLRHFLSAFAEPSLGNPFATIGQIMQQEFGNGLPGI